VPVVPAPVVPVVPVPVVPAPDRVMPVPDVSELPDAPEVPDELLPEVPLPDVDEPLAPDVEEPLVDAGGVLFMPLVPLAPRQDSVPPVPPVLPVLPLLPLVPEPLVVPISVVLEPAVPLAPEVVRSWLPVLCDFALVDLPDFCLSLDVCLSDPDACEPVEVDCAATPALTSITARMRVSFVFMRFSFCLWVHTTS
jgi:hypothetical protein